jgi:hypothetical protein
MSLPKPACLALLLLWLAGCAAAPPVKAPTPALSGDELLTILRARADRVKSFEAKGRLTLLSPQRNYSGTAFLKGIEPTTLRVDILDFLGRSLLSFSSNGQVVQVLSPKEEKFYYGKATPANMAVFIPPAVTLPQVLQLLVGALPLSSGAPDRFHFEPAADSYVLEWRRPDGAFQERLWVKASGLYPAKDEWYGQDHRMLFSVDLSDYGAAAPDLPGQITLRAENPKAELRFAYRELRVNPALGAPDIELKAPPAVAVVPLGP